MKKNAAVIFALCLLFMLVNGYCTAATLDQVAGVYPVWFDEKVSIKGIGKLSWSEDGWVEINSSGTWVNSWDYQGLANVDDKGKKLYMAFNNAGIEELEDCLVDWAYDAAAQEGVFASQLDFTVAPIKPITCKIDKTTNKLCKKFKIMAQGIFSGYLDDEFVTSKFTYKLTVTIISP